MTEVRIPKINNPQVSMDHQGHKHRSIRITLVGNQTFDNVFSDPAMFSLIQENAAIRVHPGDYVTLVAADGTAIADGCVVTKIVGGKSPGVFLSKPLRIVKLDPDQSLFTDGKHEVVVEGTRFRIRNVATGTFTDGGIAYQSADAAKSEILKMQPRVMQNA